MGQNEHFTVHADDGFKIHAMQWATEGAPRAVLHIAHGMSEYAERYARFAERCVAANIAVVAHDHRGHGRSTDANTPLGHFADNDGWNKVVEDIHSVAQVARERFPKVPLFFFGHSMGSLLGRAYVLRPDHSLSGAILSATGHRINVGNKLLAKVAEREVQQRGARAPSPLMTKLVFGTFNIAFRPSRTSFDWLSRDAAEVDKYIHDPLCGFPCSGKLWQDLFVNMYEVEAAEAEGTHVPRRMPVLLVAGSRDPVSMNGLGHKQLADQYCNAGNDLVSNVSYPQARHELLNETNREDVMRDIINWVADRARA